MSSTAPPPPSGTEDLDFSDLSGVESESVEDSGWDTTAPGDEADDAATALARHGISPEVLEEMGFVGDKEPYWIMSETQYAEQEATTMDMKKTPYRDTLKFDRVDVRRYAMFLTKPRGYLNTTRVRLREEQLANMSSDSFGTVVGLHPALKTHLEEQLGHPTMTTIQQEVLPEALEGQDVLAVADEGCGKTWAALVPALNSMLHIPKAERTTTSVIVVTHSRSVADKMSSLVTDFFKTLPDFEGTVESLVGPGEVTENYILSLQNTPPDVLLSTPKHLTYFADHQELAKSWGSVRTVVVDDIDLQADSPTVEAFRQAMSRIPVPVEKRQNILLASVLPKSDPTTYNVARAYLKPGFVEKNLTLDVLAPEAPVPHMEIVRSDFSTRIGDLWQLIKDLQQTLNHKVVVSFPTGHVMRMYSQLFKRLGLRVVNIHPKMGFARRKKLVEECSGKYNIVIFACDVTHRRLYIDGVTHWIQMGAPLRPEAFKRRVLDVEHGAMAMLYPFEVDSFVSQYGRAVDDHKSDEKDSGLEVCEAKHAGTSMNMIIQSVLRNFSERTISLYHQSFVSSRIGASHPMGPPIRTDDTEHVTNVLQQVPEFIRQELQCNNLVGVQREFADEWQLRSFPDAIISQLRPRTDRLATPRPGAELGRWAERKKILLNDLLHVPPREDKPRAKPLLPHERKHRTPEQLAGTAW